MSKNALLLERSRSSAPVLKQLRVETRAGEYAGIAGCLLRAGSVIAVIGADPTVRTAAVERGIAAELGAGGKRVVVVPAEGLSRAEVLPPAAACVPSAELNVWLCGRTAEGTVDFFPPPVRPSAPPDRLHEFRRAFDVVLLDCATADAPGVLDLAAKADAAVLVVDAGRTARQQVQRTRRVLDLAGVKLAGCVLMQRR
jgi:Mrp family chromosome partitioning ATPase